MDGRSYTSNTAKLLKHLPKLMGMQLGEVRPVMVHIAPTNICNLECTYCCYGGRNLGDQLTLQQVYSVLADFHTLGTKACEWTGGGEPTLWRSLNDAVEIAANYGYRQGLITNGIKFDWFNNFVFLDWMRVSFHGFNEEKGHTIEQNIRRVREYHPDLEISGVYIWTAGSDLVYPNIARFAEKYKIPTRVTPDLTAGKHNIDIMMNVVGKQVQENPASFTFLSDFNVKTERLHDHCYMHMVKPFVFPDGWVYVCPSIGLSPENQKNVDSPFRVCRIEEILPHYRKGVYIRNHDCQFCKYSKQNELIDEILTPVKHEAFA
jgi:MoaA/NifB/PqqE/SkfB family radical SAM enzyme